MNILINIANFFIEVLNKIIHFFSTFSFKKYSKIIYLLVAGIILIITIPIAVNLITKKTAIINYKNLEKKIMSQYEIYKNSNEIINKYYDLNTLYDFKIPEELKKCSAGSGVNVQSETEVYLICDDYVSPSLKETITKSNYISLKGDNPLVINQIDNYKDPGYVFDPIYKVIVDGEISKIPNIYNISYQVSNAEEQLDVINRTVIVVNNNLKDGIYSTDKKLSLELNGNEVVTVTHNGNYIEYGAVAFDNTEGDISHKIEVIGTVNTKKVGNYFLTYRIINKKGDTLEVSRQVRVIEPNYNIDANINYSPTEITYDKVTINVVITGDNYDYTVLPSGTKTTNKNISFAVTANGTYIFKIFNEYGKFEDKEVIISNFSTAYFTGTCEFTTTSNSSTVTVSASGSSKIVGYSYSDGITYSSFTSKNSYTYNKKITKASVKVKDEKNQINTINCTQGASTSSEMLEIHFIYTGREDAMLFRIGDHAAFIDGGVPSHSETSVNYLKALGVTKLDFIIGTHSHYNHVGALGGIVDNFEVGEVYFVENPLNCKWCNSNAYNAVNTAMKKKNMTAIISKVGDTFNLGSVKFEVVGPIKYRGSTSSYANYNSLNHIIIFGKVKTLLTGDYVDETALMDKYDNTFLDIDILKYPHHGSTSMSEKFIKKITPKYTICQTNTNYIMNKYKTSYNYLVNAGSKVYQNLTSKNIVLLTDGEKIEVRENVKAASFDRTTFNGK